MNSKIIDEWIDNKARVTVIMTIEYFDGFEKVPYSLTGTIKRSDELGILFEDKKGNVSLIPYKSIGEIELLDTDKDGVKDEI